MTAPARPLYFRLLGVRHLRVSPVAAFLLFEGSIAAGVLLALADIVNVWGIVAVPVAVAIMVKVHDRVARALVQPLAVVHMSANRPLRDRPNVGRSAVPGPARLTTEIARDDAIASPEARPDPSDPDTLDGTAIGVARVTSRGRAAVPGAARPTPGPRHPLPSEDGTGPGVDEARPGVDRTGPEEATASDASEPARTVPVRSEPVRPSERHDADWRGRGNQGHFDL
jgi:hypothetical protein